MQFFRVKTLLVLKFMFFAFFFRETHLILDLNKNRKLPLTKFYNQFTLFNHGCFKHHCQFTKYDYKLSQVEEPPQYPITPKQNQYKVLPHSPNSNYKSPKMNFQRAIYRHPVQCTCTSRILLFHEVNKLLTLKATIVV